MGSRPACGPPRWRRSLRLRGLAALLWLPVLAGCMAPIDPVSLLMAGRLITPAWQPDRCPRLASLNGSQTPEQLYRGVAACLHGSDLDSAVVLFGLAAAYGRYDSLRVADPSTHQAGMMLRLVALQQLSEPQRQTLASGMAAALSGSGGKPDLCAAIERIGPPTYQPDYMLRHGQVALRRSLSGAGSSPPPPESGLVEGFDGNAAWNQVLDRLLRCSKA